MIYSEIFGSLKPNYKIIIIRFQAAKINKKKIKEKQDQEETNQSQDLDG